MSRTYTSSAASSFGFDRSGLPVIEAVVAVARRLWPSKTAVNLSSRAGVTHRAAEFWLAQGTGMSADALAELLRSDAGREILEALMGDARPSWWPAFKADLVFADLERREADNRAAIEELRREFNSRRAR
ncbi:hypothetical protein [Microvirga sp. KLBC 81]|uniref:hypothetical protein n=1 Tax=Microvirga sp. KLBC 81 TaxID=1862707 RepID=UPI00197BD4A4|nr:hypothetical protein [Microvirga sp. KLBC 81]